MTIRFFSSRRNDPLLLLHGFAGHPESWTRFAGLAPKDRAVAALALPGHDPGSPPVAGWGWNDAIDAIADIVRREIGAPVDVLGYSMGGRVALGMLVRHPGSVRRATLVGASPGGLSDDERRARTAWDGEWSRVLRDEGLESFVSRWEALPLFATQRSLAQGVLAEQRRIRLAHDPHGLAAAMDTLGLAAMPDYEPALAAVASPVRLVVGERDAKFRAAAETMAASLPNAEVFVAPGVGHNVLLESPEFLAALFRRS